MNKSEPVCFFTDCLSSDFNQLLFGRKFEEFWHRIQNGSNREVALESIAFVLRRNQKVGFGDVRIMMKLVTKIANGFPANFERLSDLFMPQLEGILKMWILSDNMDDVSSFLQDLIAEPNLAEMGKALNLEIIKDLCAQITSACRKAFETNTKATRSTIDETIFESVKKISYNIETLAEDFVSEPSSMEFLIISKVYLSTLDKHIKYFSGINGAEEEVVWAFGRRNSWLKWLCDARKKELKLSQVRSVHNLLAITIEAHTAEMVTKNDWNLYYFHFGKRNYRDAAAILARIWIENPFDVDKLCKGFLKLKLAMLNSNEPGGKMLRFNPGLTLHDFIVRHLQMLALYSSDEYEDKKENTSEEEWQDLIQSETEAYIQSDKVMFANEIAHLKKALKMEEDILTKRRNLCSPTPMN